MVFFPLHGQQNRAEQSRAELEQSKAEREQSRGNWLAWREVMAVVATPFCHSMGAASGRFCSQGGRGVAGFGGDGR